MHYYRFVTARQKLDCITYVIYLTIIYTTIYIIIY